MASIHRSSSLLSLVMGASETSPEALQECDMSNVGVSLGPAYERSEEHRGLEGVHVALPRIRAWPRGVFLVAIMGTLAGVQLLTAGAAEAKSKSIPESKVIFQSALENSLREGSVQTTVRITRRSRFGSGRVLLKAEVDTKSVAYTISGGSYATDRGKRVAGASIGARQIGTVNYV